MKPLSTALGCPLSVLDLGMFRVGTPVSKRLADTLECARLCEDLGYNRYWLAEHHAENSACASALTLAAAVAQATRRIRVGSAGVLLETYAPFRIACDTALLSQLFPGRVDLGIARAWPGPNGFALREEPVPANEAPRPAGRPRAGDGGRFRRRLRDLELYLKEAIPVEHPHFGAVVVPEPDLRGLDVWLMSTGEAGTGLAAATGAGLALGSFLEGAPRPDAAAAYRSDFRPGWAEEPRLALAVAGVCAQTEAEAERTVRRIPPPLRPGVVGEPSSCMERLAELGERYGADEMVWVELGSTVEQRRTSLTLLAAAGGLAPAP